jgi:GT2 family glycosyltransferase
MNAALRRHSEEGTALPGAGTQSARIAILILNYNGAEDTIACLESILKDWRRQYEVMIIDNASSDGSVQKLRCWAERRDPQLEFAFAPDETAAVVEEISDLSLPRLTMLETQSNLGFAGGNNVGIRYALAGGANWILLLNNDTIVEPHTLSALIEGAERSGADLAGCTVYEYDRRTRPWYAGGIFSWWGDRTVTTLPDPPAEKHAAVETDWITGCCMLVRREVFEKIGLLDERSFLYYEDVDFCRRAAKAGLRRFVILNAKIYHKVSRSAVLGSALSRYHGTRSRLYFHRKNHSRTSHLVFLIAFGMSRIVRSLIWLFQGRPDLIKASWAGLCDYLLPVEPPAALSSTREAEIRRIVVEQERK